MDYISNIPETGHKYLMMIIFRPDVANELSGVNAALSPLPFLFINSIDCIFMYID